MKKEGINVTYCSNDVFDGGNGEVHSREANTIIIIIRKKKNFKKLAKEKGELNFK